MNIIYIIGAIITFLLFGNWYYAAHMPVAEEAVYTEAPNTEDANLISAVDAKSGISFSYPAELQTKYVSLAEWPPRFVNSVTPIKCELDEQTQAMSGATSSTETINGNTYCVWATSEGAAGSIYINYQLIYPQDSQYFTMSFTLRYPQCENYPGDEVTACHNEQANFPLNTLIDEIAQSAHLPV